MNLHNRSANLHGRSVDFYSRAVNVYGQNVLFPARKVRLQRFQVWIVVYGRKFNRDGQDVQDKVM